MNPLWVFFGSGCFSASSIEWISLLACRLRAKLEHRGGTGHVALDSSLEMALEGEVSPI